MRLHTPLLIPVQYGNMRLQTRFAPRRTMMLTHIRRACDPSMPRATCYSVVYSLIANTDSVVQLIKTTDLSKGREQLWNVTDPHQFGVQMCLSEWFAADQPGKRLLLLETEYVVTDWSIVVGVLLSEINIESLNGPQKGQNFCRSSQDPSIIQKGRFIVFC